tara:strand:+ start:527 stop:649 length:123 start_codon:yes stop_codon:yes gene_type:complete
MQAMATTVAARFETVDVLVKMPEAGSSNPSSSTQKKTYDA